MHRKDRNRAPLLAVAAVVCHILTCTLMEDEQEGVRVKVNPTVLAKTRTDCMVPKLPGICKEEVVAEVGRR
jgi:hypothetical protein